MPHGVLISIGGSAMVAKGTNELKCDPGSVASETADGVRWLLASLTAYGTPDVLIILLSVISPGASWRTAS